MAVAVDKPCDTHFHHWIFDLLADLEMNCTTRDEIVGGNSKVTNTQKPIDNNKELFHFIFTNFDPQHHTEFLHVENYNKGNFYGNYFGKCTELKNKNLN